MINDSKGESKEVWVWNVEVARIRPCLWAVDIMVRRMTDETGQVLVLGDDFCPGREGEF